MDNPPDEKKQFPIEKEEIPENNQDQNPQDTPRYKKHVELCLLIAEEATCKNSFGENIIFDTRYYISSIFDHLRDALDLFRLAAESQIEELIRIDNNIYYKESYDEIKDIGKRFAELREAIIPILRRFKDNNYQIITEEVEITNLINPVKNLFLSLSKPICGLPMKRPPGRPSAQAEWEWKIEEHNIINKKVKEQLEDESFHSRLSCDGPAKAANCFLAKLSGFCESSIESYLRKYIKSKKNK